MLPKIKIIGIGGAGGNTLSRIANYPLKGVEKIAVNTDAQELIKVKSAKKILFGQEITGGLGTGMDWRLGKKIFLQDHFLVFLNVTSEPQRHRLLVFFLSLVWQP